MITQEPEIFRMEVQASKDKIDETRKFLIGKLKEKGYDEETSFPIEVSFVELFENIIRHGYKHRPGKVDVEIELINGTVKITVIDTASGFDMVAYRGPDPVEYIKKSISRNKGIRINKSMCDSIEYKRIGDFNRNILIKKLA